MTDQLKPIPLRFWRSGADREPVREFLNSLTSDDKRVIGRDISRVQYGWPIGLPLCRPMGGGLWEIRSSLPSRRELRVLFCLFDGELVALHAFLKKTQKTDPNDLAVAGQRMKELYS